MDVGITVCTHGHTEKLPVEFYVATVSGADDFNDSWEWVMMTDCKTKYKMPTLYSLTSITMVLLNPVCLKVATLYVSGPS
jgi:hypothetical protein